MRFGKTSILPFEIGTNNMKEGRDMDNHLVNTDFSRRISFKKE